MGTGTRSDGAKRITRLGLRTRQRSHPNCHTDRHQHVLLSPQDGAYGPRSCHAPLNTCMTFNTTASSLTRHEFARPVSVSERLDLLLAAYESNLVQFGENLRRGVNFICNCCGCCCEAMLAIQRFGLIHPIHSNFLARVSEAECTGCDQCASVCPVDAVALEKSDDSSVKKKECACVDEKMCLGCGVCVRNCPTGALSLEPRPERVSHLFRHDASDGTDGHRAQVLSST